MTSPQQPRPFTTTTIEPGRAASNAIVALWVLSIVCIAVGCILTANAKDGSFPAIGGPLMLSAGSFGIPLVLATTAIVRALGR